MEGITYIRTKCVNTRWDSANWINEVYLHNHSTAQLRKCKRGKGLD